MARGNDKGDDVDIEVDGLLLDDVPLMIGTQTSRLARPTRDSPYPTLNRRSASKVKSSSSSSSKRQTTKFSC